MVVPFVQRFAGSDPLVALEADERGTQGPGHGFGGGRLAHARLAFEQQGLAEGHGEGQRGGQPVVDQVVDLVEAAPKFDGPDG